MSTDQGRADTESVDDQTPDSLVALVLPTDPRHNSLAQLLIAWAPLSLILLAYAVAGWISAPLGTADGADTNRLGFGVHVAGPADADRTLFGTVPTVWLQERLLEGSPGWYDALAAIVYATHFVTIPLLTAGVWFCLRHRFTEWLTVVLAFTTIGVSGYVVYPAAPPWLAAERGVIGEVDRISTIGWSVLQLDWLGRLTTIGQEGSNPVAAMPSLHAGAALLCALFLWGSVNAAWRTLLLTYAASMALTLVYTGEHYVVDVLVGWLTAVLAVAVGALLRRRSAHRMAAGAQSSVSATTTIRPSSRRSKSGPVNNASGKATPE